jgi:hypothetical protein
MDSLCELKQITETAANLLSTLKSKCEDLEERLLKVEGFKSQSTVIID